MNQTLKLITQIDRKKSLACRGENSNRCVAEGCFGFSCLSLAEKKSQG